MGDSAIVPRLQLNISASNKLEHGTGRSIGQRLPTALPGLLDAIKCLRKNRSSNIKYIGVVEWCDGPG